MYSVTGANKRGRMDKDSPITPTRRAQIIDDNQSDIIEPTDAAYCANTPERIEQRERKGFATRMQPSMLDKSLDELAEAFWYGMEKNLKR